MKIRFRRIFASGCYVSAAETSEFGEAPAVQAPYLDEYPMGPSSSLLSDLVLGRGLSDRPLLNVGGFVVVNVQTSSLDPMPRCETERLTLHTTMNLRLHFGGFAEVTVNSVPSGEVRVDGMSPDEHDYPLR